MIDLTKPQKGLISTNSWLYTKDGHCYKAFFGICQIFKAEAVIGCRTGSGQADFVIQIGKRNSFLIAGCQFHSFHLCDKVSSKARDIYEVE